MLQFLIGGCGRDQQAMSVTRRQSSDNPSARDRRMNDRHDILQFGFKDRVKVGGRGECCQAVRVGEL